MKSLALTGNPFIDVGLGIIAARSGKSSVNGLTSEDARAAIADMLADIEPIKRLKVLSRFWQNNSYTGINPGTFPLYEELLQHLARISPPARQGNCQVCGQANVFRTANRSWFPLAGGSDDACTLPGLSGKWLCADCFRAVVLLPLGCRFCSSGPYFIHVADPEMQVEAVEESVESVRGQLSARASGNNALKEQKTRLQGRVELLAIMSGSIIWDTTVPGVVLPPGGATIIAFNNEKKAKMLQVHLPAQALAFLAELNRAGLRTPFLQWAERCNGETYKDKTTKEDRTNPFFDQICDGIEQRRSIAPLLAAIVRERVNGKAKQGATEPLPVLPAQEKQVLAIYEDKLLDKRERFETMERIARKVNGMQSQHRDSFVRRLGNLRSKRSLLDLLVEHTKSLEKYGLTLTRSEIQMINETPDNEIISLLFLLCVAKDEEATNAG